MNFNDYKAKHAKLATSTKTAVDTTAAKIDASVKKTAVKTKEVAANTGNFITGSVPVTSRKHNAFASEVNAKLNGVSRHLEYHEVLFDVLSDYVGAELPSKETVYQYLDQRDAEAQAQQATTPIVQEELVAGIVSKVLSSLGINQSPLSAEGEAFVTEQQGNAPTAAQEKAADAGEDVTEADAKAKKEQRRLAALAKKQIEEAVVEQQEEPEVEEEVEEKEKPVKTIKRKRKAGGMGRQQPLAAE